MKKLIPKYQKGRWLRVKIKNTDRNKPGRYGYIDVDDNNRPWEWNESRPNLFMVHPDSPSSEGYWTEIDTDSSNDYNHNIPTYDLSTVIVTPKNREEIKANKDIELNNANYYLYNNAGDEVLRDWQLAQQLGSASRVWFDASGTPHREFGEQGMSGADPVGRFYVEGVGLGKAIEGGLLLGRYLKRLRTNFHEPSSILNSESGTYSINSSIHSNSLYLDYPRQQAIIDYIYTGNKTQPQSPIGGYIKPIDYSDEFQRLIITGFPRGVEATYKAEIIPRMVNERVLQREEDIRSMIDEGIVSMTEGEIGEALSSYEKSLTEELEGMLNNREYISVSPRVMEEYNYRHNNSPTRTVAFFDPITKKIVIQTPSKGYEDNSVFNRFLGHEVRHWYDNLYPLTINERLYLNKAYNDVFDKLPELYPSIYPKGYDMHPERVTTNRDARDYIFNNLYYFRPSAIRDQNKIIDSIPGSYIIEAVENCNGYGSTYIKALRERGMLTPELVQSLRDAMKYVGMSTAAVTVANLLNK